MSLAVEICDVLALFVFWLVMVTLGLLLQGQSHIKSPLFVLIILSTQWNIHTSFMGGLYFKNIQTKALQSFSSVQSTGL